MFVNLCNFHISVSGSLIWYMRIVAADNRKSKTAGWCQTNIEKSEETAIYEPDLWWNIETSSCKYIFPLLLWKLRLNHPVDELMPCYSHLSGPMCVYNRIWGGGLNNTEEAVFIFPPEFYSNIGMMIIFACIMYICNMWWRSIVQCTSQEKLQECSFVVSGELIAFFWPAPRSQKGSRRREQGGDRWWPDVR